MREHWEVGCLHLCRWGFVDVVDIISINIQAHSPMSRETNRVQSIVAAHERMLQDHASCFEEDPASL